jgi:hypothetical protein
MLNALLFAWLGIAHATSPAPGLARLAGDLDAGRYQAWAQRQAVEDHPERYRFMAEVHRDLGRLSRERPGVIRPFSLGRTVQKRDIWAFRIRDPARPVYRKVLVFAGIHPLEWISTETATALAEELSLHPIPGVEVVVVPALNVDRRMMVEDDLLDGRNVFRRTNLNGVDLNRDFAIHREPRAIWRHVIPGYYASSPGPLSQPESQALDRLLQEGFDVAVSLHAFGGFFYTPWAGIWKRPEHMKTFRRLGDVMGKAQGSHAYKTRQLSRWGFFFRAHGAEIDHIYGKYGTLAFLMELTRSGMNPLRPQTLRSHLRFYNPTDPTRHVDKGVSALRALIGTLSQEGEAAPRRVVPPGD